MTTLARLERACAATGLDRAEFTRCWRAARLLPKRRPAPTIPHDAHGPGPAHGTSVGAWARHVRLAGRG